MKANELRIGNWIQFNTGYQYQVDMIYKDYANFKESKPISLTEEWLLLFGFENWGAGKLYSNEFETYDRYVLHNVLGGTSNFEIHFIKSTYGYIKHYQYVISCDEDDRLNWGEEIINVHQLQNLYFALVGSELQLLEADA